MLSPGRTLVVLGILVANSSAAPLGKKAPVPIDDTDAKFLCPKGACAVPRKVPEGFKGPKRARWQCALFSDEGAVTKSAKVEVYNEKQQPPGVLEKLTAKGFTERACGDEEKAKFAVWEAAQAAADTIRREAIDKKIRSAKKKKGPFGFGSKIAKMRERKLAAARKAAKGPKGFAQGIKDLKEMGKGLKRPKGMPNWKGLKNGLKKGPTKNRAAARKPERSAEDKATFNKFLKDAKAKRGPPSPRKMKGLFGKGLKNRLNKFKDLKKKKKPFPSLGIKKGGPFGLGNLGKKGAAPPKPNAAPAAPPVAAKGMRGSR